MKYMFFIISIRKHSEKVETPKIKSICIENGYNRFLCPFFQKRKIRIELKYIDFR